MVTGIKKRFDDFESVETVAKSPCVKSYQRKTEIEIIEFFTFITNCKSFRPSTFCELFCYVFNGFEISIKFCFFDTRMECLPTKFVFAPICTFCEPKQNAHETAQITKNV